MIKEALQYIIGLKDTETLYINGEPYVKQGYVKIPDATPYKKFDLTTASLSGFTSYILNGCDGSSADNKKIIEIKNNEEVCFVSESCADTDYRRDDYIMASAQLPGIRFGWHLPMEEFLVQLQTCFDREQGDWEDLIKLASSIQLKEEIKASDDGVSQSVVAKTGVARVSEVQIPNPVMLAPIRTFQELKQPLSPFIFRINKNGEMGLFEADGGAWQYSARESIKEYLDKALGNIEGLTILA